MTTMRHLSPEMTKLIREHEESMAAIAADRARWAREKGTRVSRVESKFTTGGESVGTSWVRPSPRQVPRPTVRPPLSKAAHGQHLPPARSEPTRVCLICLTPAFLVVGTLRCQACASEIRWRVSLARQGLRVIP